MSSYKKLTDNNLKHAWKSFSNYQKYNYKRFYEMNPDH